MGYWTISDRAAAVDAILSRAPALPVLSIARLEHAVPLARALVEGGLPVLEITLRTPIAVEAIRRIARELPGAIIGAGTVLSGADLEAVSEAGATFAISPGATGILYSAAAKASIPWIPAIATASELMLGMENGHRRFKFFPAESSGGTAALKGFGGPFGDARFCPTGGIDLDSYPKYLAVTNVVTVGGSWMAPTNLINNERWDEIRTLAAQTVTAGKAVSK